LFLGATGEQHEGQHEHGPEAWMTYLGEHSPNIMDRPADPKRYASGLPAAKRGRVTTTKVPRPLGWGWGPWIPMSIIDSRRSTSARPLVISIPREMWSASRRS